MAAVGAHLTTNREKRKYGQRTVLTGMRRCEVMNVTDVNKTEFQDGVFAAALHALRVPDVTTG